MNSLSCANFASKIAGSVFFSFVAGFVSIAQAEDKIQPMVQAATQTLAAKQGSASPIPKEALAAAKGVAIIDITKGGFIVGGTGGSGIVVLKAKQGVTGLVGMQSWVAPIPIGFSGGSFGAQIGGSNTKMIVLLNSDQAVKVFTNPGKLAWNAQASGTAGADTETEAAGGALSEVDVTIYKETEGLYGGATFGGTTLSIQDDRIKSTYGPEIFVRDIIEGKVKAPEYAKPLINLLEGKR
jgi:lipid-binding SYLF domain-containing protein